MLANLDDVAKANNWDTLLPKVVSDVMKVKGSYAAVPVNVHRVNWLWANPEALKKANAKLPTTWDEFFVTADLYQVNCTFYDAMARNDRAYLLARAIQFFMPGIPQVYYVGLLAGHNDMELLARSGVGRDINRHHYTPEEIALQMARPVVQDLIALQKLRNTHAAFEGRFELRESDDATIAMRWTNGAETAQLRVDLNTLGYELLYSSPEGLRAFNFRA